MNRGDRKARCEFDFDYPVLFNFEIIFGWVCRCCQDAISVNNGALLAALIRSVSLTVDSDILTNPSYIARQTVHDRKCDQLRNFVRMTRFQLRF